MKTLTERIKEAFAVMLLVAACVVSVGQLSANALSDSSIKPGDSCSGLACVGQEDCGPAWACFCNRPSQSCYGEVD